jgi:hypothetical protein
LEKRSSEANENDKVRRRPAFNLQTANLRSALIRTAHAVSNLRPTLRVNLSLRAVRAAAIALPVLLLAIVAVSLLVETGRHQPLHSAQVASQPSLPTAAAAVNSTTTLSTTNRRASRYAKTTRNVQPRPTPPLEVSHKHVTERVTLSVVQGLSRYEISGLRRQAKYGDASASFTLGMAYEVGRNVPQDCTEAARWVTKAAEAGNSAAQYNLGLRYREGDGVYANRAESEKWLRKAAARKNRQAKSALKVLARR